MADPKAGAAGPDAGTEQVVRTPEEQLAELEKGKAGGADAGEVVEVEEVVEGVEDEASVERARQFMLKKGINELGKLADLASDLETRNTKLDQEVRRLSAVTGTVHRGGLGQAGAVVEDDEIKLDLPENPIDLVMDKKALEKYSLSLIELGEKRQAKRDQAKSFSSVQARVQAKMEANPEEFFELRQTMFDLSKVDPEADIDVLYDRAKAHRDTKEKAMAARIRKELGITAGDQTDKLKGLSARLRTSPITAGTGVQVTAAQSAGEKEHQELLKAIATADKY